MRTRVRALAIFLSGAWIGLAGCVASPKSLGITGPGNAGLGAQPMAPSASALDPDASKPTENPAQQDTAIPAPGVPSDFGARYAPSVGPSYGTDGKYYGYN